MQKIKNNIFLRSAIAEVPRLLGQLDRYRMSRSYGSFDRAYWHYRTSDISCARHQEAALTLALLYASDVEGNPYAGDKRIRAWCDASLAFSLSIQDTDGSFSEWYPYEGSFVATAFVTAALSEALLLLGKDVVRSYEQAVHALSRAADWLLSHNESLVRNQEAGCLLALINMWMLTGDARYKDGAHKKARDLVGAEDSEGWWSEYGGPDIGYLSLTVDYLVKYHAKSGDEAVVGAITRATDFIMNFLHPNYTAGGEYGSRNTEYLIPSGFTLFAAHHDRARLIGEFCRVSLERGSGITPQNLDDRYLSYILYNWLQAGLAYKELPGKTIEDFLRERRIDRYFPRCGIRVIDTGRFYFVTNLYKGGPFRLYTGGRAYLDSGVDAIVKGSAMTSNALDLANTVMCSNALEKNFSCRGFLKSVSEPLMKTWTMIAFKGFQMLVGRFGGVRALLKKILRKYLITAPPRTRVPFERSFRIMDDGVIVRDRIGVRPEDAEIFYGEKSSYSFIPSSRYYQRQEGSPLRIRHQEIIEKKENEVVYTREIRI
ncbi:MAG: hypothetical protein A2676_01465 [Candidatus Sungbacteria bacterium RIFCSPHIGHO2_01_FULL_51_22]|nr:MAG: hypothetical protein A2676_01465 [Candidatus Sungbacteria bacterium RIFCSPHIGHO2_01_FULL_51_22]